MKLCSFDYTNEYNYNELVNKYFVHNLSYDICFDLGYAIKTMFQCE